MPPKDTTERLVRRYKRAPHRIEWPSDGTLPDAGLLVHCFDGHESEEQPWRPALGMQNHGSSDLSTSLIFQAQLYDDKGFVQFGQHERLKPSNFLFGHGCREKGGIIFRSGPSTRVKCGNGQDAGQECGTVHPWCPSLTTMRERSDRYAPPCDGAWHPGDIGTYLARDLHALRSGSSSCVGDCYNEFLIDGEHWDQNLPHAIEAFLEGSSGGDARSAHQRFLWQFGLSSAGVQGVPLVAISDDAGVAFTALIA